jgi:hypothetical protein
MRWYGLAPYVSGTSGGHLWHGNEPSGFITCYYYYYYLFLTANGFSPGGSSTTIGQNRQVTHITQSNNPFQQDTNTKHNNKEHPTTMNTKQIGTTENINTTSKKNTQHLKHN